MARDKKIYVLSEIDHCDFPEKPNEFMAFWQGHIESIPEAYIDSAAIYISAEQDRGCAHIDVEISYIRPENKDEEYKRKKSEKCKEYAIEDSERRTLKKLKAKYE